MGCRRRRCRQPDSGARSSAPCISPIWPWRTHAPSAGRSRGGGFWPATGLRWSRRRRELRARRASGRSWRMRSTPSLHGLRAPGGARGAPPTSRSSSARRPGGEQFIALSSAACRHPPRLELKSISRVPAAVPDRRQAPFCPPGCEIRSQAGPRPALDSRLRPPAATRGWPWPGSQRSPPLRRRRAARVASPLRGEGRMRGLRGARYGPGIL